MQSPQADELLGYTEVIMSGCSEAFCTVQSVPCGEGKTSVTYEAAPENKKNMSHLSSVVTNFKYS